MSAPSGMEENPPEPPEADANDPPIGLILAALSGGLLGSLYTQLRPHADSERYVIVAGACMSVVAYLAVEKALDLWKRRSD